MKTTRTLADRAWTIAACVCVCLALIPLVSILFDVVSRGVGALSITLLAKLPAPPGYPGGGISNAIIGTLVLVALGSTVGIPIGILSGVYISEYSSSRFGPAVRFFGDVLAGIPSIVTGVLVYCLIVLEFHRYSALAGGIALGMIMIPISSNTTTEALRAVPDSIREASLALGIHNWRTSMLVVSNAKSAIATGALLSIARITGETAPLIFTAEYTPLAFSGLDHPVASLTVVIYQYALSPFAIWQSQAWGAALILVLIVLGINICVRLATRNRG